MRGRESLGQKERWDWVFGSGWLTALAHGSSATVGRLGTGGAAGTHGRWAAP